MRKIANIITAHIYIFVVRKITNQTRTKILEGEEISKFGANLVFSYFVLMILIMITFYVGIWGFQLIISFYQH